MKRRAQLPPGRLRNWAVTKRADGVVVFHGRDHPVRVWAVQVTSQGLLWADAEIVKITKTRVTIRYQDTLAPVSREGLPSGSAVWRGVWFTSDRDGFVAHVQDANTGQWHRYVFEAAPDAMPLDLARRLLGVPVDFTRDDIVAGFRAAAKRCHPDQGGTAEKFRELVKARDRLLASIGRSEPAPRAPAFPKAGMSIRYSRRRVPNRPARIEGGSVKQLGDNT